MNVDAVFAECPVEVGVSVLEVGEEGDSAVVGVGELIDLVSVSSFSCLID